jgi:hypothetical protein
MSFLPRVSEHTREAVSREFDDLGPRACVERIVEDLRGANPEWLDMAQKCARDTDASALVMVGFCMFYRLLTAQAATEYGLNTLPKVTIAARESVLQEIDRLGAQAFTDESIRRLDHENPELLQMAHAFASRHSGYLQIMQGVALLWACLALQLRMDRTHMH